MVIVFGAGGFIGTYLIDQLVADGLDVIACDISEIARSHFDQRRVSYRHVDITKKEQFDILPKERIEAVVHLACIQPANVSEQEYSPIDYVMVNVVGTLNILEFCRLNGVPKIIYTCSHRNTQGLWAEKGGKPILETDGRAILFTGDYAMFSISESAASDCVEHYTQRYGIEGIILRLPPVYGFGPHLEIFKDGKPIKTGFLALIEDAEQARPLVLWGDPSIARDIVYVKDVVAAIMLALHRTGVSGLYNISSGRRLSLQDQAECVIRVFSQPGKRSEIRYQPEKLHYLESYVYDIGKAREILGWQPKYSFEDMLWDYRKERESGRFAFLIQKRKALIERAAPASAKSCARREGHSHWGK
jgi:UDP-glucose 4-epimerase